MRREAAAAEMRAGNMLGAPEMRSRADMRCGIDVWRCAEVRSADMRRDHVRRGHVRGSTATTEMRHAAATAAMRGTTASRMRRTAAAVPVLSHRRAAGQKRRSSGRT